MTPKKPVGRELGEAWRYDTLGYTFAFSVIIFAGAGWLLDGLLGTKPFLTIAGTILGAGLAFLWVFLKVKQDEAEFHKRHDAEGDGKR